MPLSTVSCRDFRLAWLILALGVWMPLAGCQSVRPPVWQSSLEFGTGLSARSTEVPPASSRPTARVVARHGSTGAPIRLIALDDTAPDPPYRPTNARRKGRAERRVQLFGAEGIRGKSPHEAFARFDEPDRSRAGQFVRGIDSAEGEGGALIGVPLEEEGSDDWVPDDEPLLDLDETEEEEDACRFSWRDDLYDLAPVLWNDALACISWPNAIILAAAAGAAVAIRDDLDGQVRDYTAEHPLRWGTGSQVLRQFGEFSYQLPVIGAIYGWGLWSQDERLHEFGKTLISAYSITAVTTVLIKGMTDTNRPTDEFQDGDYGFPSYHTASGFAIAAVADEYYGWPVGLPSYVLAGLIGWSRIDQREHDLSDVVFGSVLGFVIGKSVAAAHMDGITGCKIVPCYNPATQSFGAVFHKDF